MKKKLLVSTMALAAVAVVAVATEPIASVGVNNTVVANEVSASMNVNPVRIGDTILSGTGVANDNLTIQNLSTGKFYSAVVAADGTWSVPVDAAAEGQKFLVTSNSLPFSSPTKIVSVVVEQGVKASFDVFDVKAGSLVVSGKGAAGERVSVVAQLPDNSTKTYSAVADADGNWSVSVEPAQSGTTFTAIGSVTQTYVSKAVDGVKPTPEKPVEQEVKVSFDVFDVKEGTVVVSGKGAAGENVSVVAQLPDNSTKSYSAVADADGNWSVSVDAAEAGTTFTGIGSVTQTYVSKAVNGVIPKPEESKPEETKPEKPEVKLSFDVFDVKAGSEVLSGKGVPGEKVSVVAQLPDKSTKSYSGVVDANGNWSVVIDKAQPGTVYTAIGSVTQTNVSKAVDGVKPQPNKPATENKNDKPNDTKESSSSKSSSTKASSSKSSSSASASSSSQASSSEKGSKESKSTEAAVNDAKKAAKPAQEGQKVLPNTAAVK